jgi:hypothetical protein
MIYIVYRLRRMTLTRPDNPNAVSRMAQRGSTALDLALANDKEEVAAVLRAHGVHVSLFFAAEKGMTDEIAARIAAGQDVNACNEESRTALELALENDQEEAAAVLRAHGAQVSLFFAAEKGMTDEIAACIAAGQDVNARDQVIFMLHIYTIIYVHTC